MSIIASVTTPLTDEQERTRHFAYRVARIAADVLFGDETAWSTSLDPHRDSDGFKVRLDADGAPEAFWQTTYVRRPGEYINRAEVQAFDADRYGHRTGHEISAKVSVGRYPYAGETYLSSVLSDESIRQIIRAMDTVFWLNRNRTSLDRKDPGQAANGVSGALSGAGQAAEGTDKAEPSLASETALRRDTIATDLAATILDHVSGVLDDEELDERLQTISGLITSWGSCPTSVAEAMESMIWHHDRRNLNDEEITNRLVHLRTLVRTADAGER